MVKIEFIAVVEDRRNEFKLRLGVDNSPNQYNNPMGYKLGLGLAERKGFEPSIRYKRIHAFQACALNHSATSLIETKLNYLSNLKIVIAFFVVISAMSLLFN